jgi:beta-glucosidase
MKARWPVKDGSLPEARLDDAVRRILRVKMRMGLFDKPKPSERALGGKFELLGRRRIAGGAAGRA